MLYYEVWSPHHSPLVFSKGAIFNQLSWLSGIFFFAYLYSCCLAFLWYFGVCFALPVYEHFWLPLHNSCLYYESVWLVWPIISTRLLIALFTLLMQVDELLEMPLVNEAWKNLVLIVTHLLEESLASMSAWGRDQPLALFRVHLGRWDTHKWHAEDLKTTWGHDHPLALFRVQLGHSNTYKWHAAWRLVGVVTTH